MDFMLNWGNWHNRVIGGCPLDGWACVCVSDICVSVCEYVHPPPPHTHTRTHTSLCLLVWIRFRADLRPVEAGGPYSGLMLVSDIVVFTKPYGTHMYVRTHTHTHRDALIWNQTEHSHMLQTDRQTWWRSHNHFSVLILRTSPSVWPRPAFVMRVESPPKLNICNYPAELLLLQCSLPDIILFLALGKN